MAEARSRKGRHGCPNASLRFKFRARGQVTLAPGHTCPFRVLRAHSLRRSLLRPVRRPTVFGGLRNSLACRWAHPSLRCCHRSSNASLPSSRRMGFMELRPTLSLCISDAPPRFGTHLPPYWRGAIGARSRSSISPATELPLYLGDLLHDHRPLVLVPYKRGFQ